MTDVRRVEDELEQCLTEGFSDMRRVSSGVTHLDLLWERTIGNLFFLALCGDRRLWLGLGFVLVVIRTLQPCIFACTDGVE